MWEILWFEYELFHTSLVGHLIPRKVCLFERLWNLQEMGSPWWKWIARGRLLMVTLFLDSSLLPAICHSEQPLPLALIAADQASHHVVPTAMGPNALKPGAKVTISSVDCSCHLFIYFDTWMWVLTQGMGAPAAHSPHPGLPPPYADSTESRCFPYGGLSHFCLVSISSSLSTRTTGYQGRCLSGHDTGTAVSQLGKCEPQ